MAGKSKKTESGEISISDVASGDIANLRKKKTTTTTNKIHNPFFDFTCLVVVTLLALFFPFLSLNSCSLN